LVDEFAAAAKMQHPFEELLFDRIDSDLTILAVNDSEAAVVDIDSQVMIGRTAASLYDPASLLRLRNVLTRPAQEGAACAFPVTLRRSDGARLEFVAVALRGGSADRPVLDIFKARPFESDGGFSELAESNEIMWAIIQAAREAIWCIRYDRPVDLTVSTDEIVNQIFEHPSVWYMCNNAMAKAYGLRDETDLNARNVRFHWPRNPVNEAFIREVIASGFRVEGAISEDYRRDGTPVMMENDVRAHIVGGRLYRMWGTLREVRPLSMNLQNERFELAALAYELLPLPACLIRSDGTLVTENAAWRVSFGTLGEISAKMAFRSASVGEDREIVLPLPLASGETQHHLVTSRWQTMTEMAAASGAATYLAVTARLIETGSGGGG